MLQLAAINLLLECEIAIEGRFDYLGCGTDFTGDLELLQS